MRGSLCRTKSISMDDGHFYIVMEWLGEGNSEAAMGPLPVDNDTARHTAQQALKGLRTLHTHNVTHCDVSLRNLMPQRSRAVLVDFDTALVPGLDRHTNVWGTLNYTAPEVFESCDYGPASDLWAMGVCIFELVTGRMPFFCLDRRPQSVRNALKAMRRGVRFTASDGVPDAAQDLIRGLLTYDKHRRIQSGGGGL
ncbi:unnamed protein product [Vitrella brassicaformis CCMP3155]|uniref:non-specific serine/threonine protein kinase n=1 Tax=Vitrella brassicaformis (strain CCMP3155) TaxID=1169540 RepID=A0A0G4H0A5_VITBC|nr:unnamed protein product [Vitrella brassicaformis CCMP3155]|eukprot:CEM36841.1 unnamed protein product [Vitrella brassicaformis CCMP3155]